MARSGSPLRSWAECGAFPGFVLAAVLGELDGAEPAGESGEGAAGVDLGELAGVTDEHDLGAGGLGVSEEPLELAGADHSAPSAITRTSASWVPASVVYRLPPSIDRCDCFLTKGQPGHGDRAVGQAGILGPLLAEHDVQFGVAEGEMVALVDQSHVDLISARFQRLAANSRARKPAPRTSTRIFRFLSNQDIRRLEPLLLKAPIEP